MFYRYGKDHLNQDYWFPRECENRFDYIIKKINKAQVNDELYNGYTIVLKNEFSEYKVAFKKGQRWFKKTPTWCGNEPSGTPIKIVAIKDNFIYYKKLKKLWRFNVTVGPRMVLNKWSFLRIFAKLGE